MLFQNVLPLYFKHSKFASFVRQLNFYSFRKLRSPEPDLRFNNKCNSNNNTVQFAHDYFRRGRPDLLHSITRITKSQEPSCSEMKSLRDDIASLHNDIVNISRRFDQRVQSVVAAAESDYQQRMNSITLSYQTLSTLSSRIISPSTSPVPPVTRSSHSSHESLNFGGAIPSAERSQGSVPRGCTISFDSSNFTSSAICTDDSGAMSRTTFEPVLHFVTDGSSTSSSATCSESSPPSPPKNALSVLSCIASAMMEEFES
jgi:hypothetical protein